MPEFLIPIFRKAWGSLLPQRLLGWIVRGEAWRVWGSWALELYTVQLDVPSFSLIPGGRFMFCDKRGQLGSIAEKALGVNSKKAWEEGLLEGVGKVAWNRFTFPWMSVLLPLPVYPAFPDWIPTTWTVRAQDWPQACLPLLSGSSLLAQCQTAIYKAIFFVLDNSMNPKTLGNKIGNWLDWEKGVLFVILLSEGFLMTWNSSNEGTTMGSVQMASGFQ